MMYKYGDKIRVKTYLGDIREGMVKEVLGDSSLMVDIDEQIMPHLNHDVYFTDRSGRQQVVYKSGFPNWQAWVKPEWVLGYVEEPTKEVK
jgi:hypothetical protein